MAIGTQFSEIVTDLRLELGFSENAAINIQYDATLKHHLNKEYERLWNDFDWPHLWGSTTNGWFDKTVSAGDRYYDYPAGMDPLSIKRAWFKWGDVWMPLSDTLSPAHYTVYNSDDNTIRSDPPLTWRQHTYTQFELWPIPATTGNTVRFEARRAFAPLVNASDICYLDDLLVMLAAATKIKKTRKGESGYGGELGKLFRRHYSMLKHRASSKRYVGFVPPDPPTDVVLPRISVARVEV